MRQSASALYSEVLTKRDLGIALFIKCLKRRSEDPAPYLYIF